MKRFTRKPKFRGKCAKWHCKLHSGCICGGIESCSNLSISMFWFNACQCQNDQFRRMFECQSYKSNWCSPVLADIDKIYDGNLDYYFRIFKFNEDLLANLNLCSPFQ